MKELQDKADEWYNEFLDQKKKKAEPLSKETGSVFMGVTLKELRAEVIDPAFEEIQMYRLIKLRAEYIHLKLSPFTIFFLCYMCDRPGTAVMYLYFIKMWCVKNKVESVNMEVLASVFPMGFMSDDSLEHLWSKQKIDSGNLLDILSY